MQHVRVLLIAAAVMAVALLGFSERSSTTPTSAAARVQDVILLHGWQAAPWGWTIARIQYEAAGFTVHALELPRNGTQPGDTLVNANYVEAYIADHRLTSVQVDGHSMGGLLVYELIRVRQNPAIVSAVTRDSGIQNETGDSGAICSDWLTWLLGTTIIPDQCEGSLVRNRILSAPMADVPVLNLSRGSYDQADVDCHRQYLFSHNRFLFDFQVTMDAIDWANGGDPCAAALDEECPWWLWFLGFCGQVLP